jgi:transcriptional regulator GlxA family with amidase domain
MTKTMAESASPPDRIEVGLVCDAGTSRAGFYGLADLFAYAGEMAATRLGEGAGAPVRITHWEVSHDDAAVRCAFDSAPDSPPTPTVLLIPGNTRAPFEGARESPLIAWLREQHSRGVILAAACGGVFILARTGLLEGRQATTHWAFSEQFATQFPEVLTETDRMVIDYGDVMTGGGVLAWADLGLRVTERLLGPTVMIDTARYMNIDPPGREQRFYSGFAPRTKHGDEAILKAQHWLSARRERPIAIAEMARRVGLAPRTFLRRFVQATGMKPTEYQQRLRMSRARELLEFSRVNLDEVAARVGYQDVGGFRRVFRRIVGLTPSDYRRRFCRLGAQSV